MDFLIFLIDDLKAMITLTPAIRFNGGGHLNHSIFWQNLSPDGIHTFNTLLINVILYMNKMSF